MEYKRGNGIGFVSGDIPLTAAQRERIWTLLAEFVEDGMIYRADTKCMMGAAVDLGYRVTMMAEPAGLVVDGCALLIVAFNADEPNFTCDASRDAWMRARRIGRCRVGVMSNGQTTSPGHGVMMGHKPNMVFP